MIEFSHVSKLFGTQKAVNDLNLNFQEGSFSVLIGTSGSGKSTTLKMINRLVEHDSGVIRFAGEEIRSLPVLELRRRMGYAIQSIGLFPHWSVAQNIASVPQLQKWSRARIDDRIDELMALLGLEPDLRERYPHQLSGGQQQRVALARALVMRPGLLLLDEPLSNLDAKLRESMRFEISSIQKELGITVIYVTHDQSEAMTMSDRVVVMSRGVIQQIGTPYEIYRNPANKMVADFIGLVNFVEGEVQGDRVYISGTGVSFPNTSGITGSATIAVRPENITMSRTSGTIEGTLVHRFYLGDAVDYRVQCKHHVIRVIVKGAELKEFTDGEKVYLDFDKIMVFDRD